jgi:predicted DNA-binding transcriptional regulator AlpA
MSSVNQQTLVEPLLCRASEAARLCGVSRSHWLLLHSSGRVPLPLKLGNRTLWSREELAAWIRCGAPSRERWEAIKGQQR